MGGDFKKEMKKKKFKIRSYFGSFIATYFGPTHLLTKQYIVFFANSSYVIVDPFFNSNSLKKSFSPPSMKFV